MVTLFPTLTWVALQNAPVMDDLSEPDPILMPA